MAVSDAEYQAWLDTDGVYRAILVEATHSAGTKYFGSSPYITSSTDTPASTPFLDLLKSIPSITTDFYNGTSFGDLVLVNDGELDSWLDLKWVGYALEVKIGDPSWAYSDFRYLVDGINAGISAPDNDSIAFKLFDKSELFNVKLQTNKITANPTTLVSHDLPKPISLGTCFNVEPILTIYSSLTYIAHDGACTISAVRDNGVAVGYTDNTDGTFFLTVAPVGKVTCDVSQTDTTTKKIVEYICNKISFTDIDTANLTAFANTDVLGVHVKDEITADSLMTEVLNSVGGTWRFNKDGDLEIQRLDLPSSEDIEITSEDVEEFGLTLSEIEQPNTEIIVNYERNYAPQDKDGQAGAVTADVRELYATEYQTVTKTNSLSGFPTATEKDPINTFFTTSANAQTECDRRATIRSDLRHIYHAKVFSKPFSISIGDTITLTYPRYGFDAGVLTIVTSITEYPTEARAELDLWL